MGHALSMKHLPTHSDISDQTYIRLKHVLQTHDHYGTVAYECDVLSNNLKKKEPYAMYRMLCR